MRHKRKYVQHNWKLLAERQKKIPNSPFNEWLKTYEGKPLQDAELYQLFLLQQTNLK